MLAVSSQHPLQVKSSSSIASELAFSLSICVFICLQTKLGFRSCTAALGHTTASLLVTTSRHRCSQQSTVPSQPHHGSLTHNCSSAPLLSTTPQQPYSQPPSQPHLSNARFCILFPIRTPLHIAEAPAAFARSQPPIEQPSHQPVAPVRHFGITPLKQCSLQSVQSVVLVALSTPLQQSSSR